MGEEGPRGRWNKATAVERPNVSYYACNLGRADRAALLQNPITPSAWSSSFPDTTSTSSRLTSLPSHLTSLFSPPPTSRPFPLIPPVPLTSLADLLHDPDAHPVRLVTQHHGPLVAPLAVHHVAVTHRRHTTAHLV